MDALPEECVRACLEPLNAYDLHTACFVCKRWNAFATEESMWKAVCVRDFQNELKARAGEIARIRFARHIMEIAQRGIELIDCLRPSGKPHIMDPEKEWQPFVEYRGGWKRARLLPFSFADYMDYVVVPRVRKYVELAEETKVENPKCWSVTMGHLIERYPCTLTDAAINLSVVPICAKKVTFTVGCSNSDHCQTSRDVSYDKHYLCALCVAIHIEVDIKEDDILFGD
jgi:hypothetical protein